MVKENLYIKYSLEEFLYTLKIDGDISVSEGLIEQHIKNERKRDLGIVKQAKEEFKRNNGDRLFCEVCGFDFNSSFYGKHAIEFIEAHHDMVHIKDMKEGHRSRKKDLRMVCSNCHEVLHRHYGITVDELREAVSKIR